MSVKPWVFAVEPTIDLVLRGDVLVDVPRFVAQIQHDTVAHGFVVLVGVDVRAEGLDARLLVALQQRRSGETDQHRLGKHLPHGAVEFAGLGAVTFIDEDEDFAGGPEAARKLTTEIGEESIEIVFIGGSEFVNERTDQPIGRGGQRLHEVGAASGAANLFSDAAEDLFDLLVQLHAVGDDQHTAVLRPLPDPLRQPDHDEALAATLRVPDDAALSGADAGLRGLDSLVLAVPTSLSDSPVEGREVADEFEEPVLGAELAEFAEE